MNTGTKGEIQTIRLLSAKCQDIWKHLDTYLNYVGAKTEKFICLQADYRNIFFTRRDQYYYYFLNY